jgi:nucleotide-binding universal stress UspA family protein
MYRSILVATDLLPTSFPALRAGLRLAQEQSAKVAVVYVLEVWMIERSWFSDVTQDDIAAHRALMQREEQAVVREVREQIRRACVEEQIELEVDPIVRDGRASTSLVSAAAERNCDLIVVGTRGRGATLGSVAAQVVRIAGRPVLVVPADLAS